MKVSIYSQVQLVRSVFASVILIAYTSIGVAQDAPIIQPGAPGESPQKISAEQALEIADTGHSKADAQFMKDMIKIDHARTFTQKKGEKCGIDL